ncbi:MAG: NAD(P)H-dependent glycerol-3-phosphate dehydrogenase [Aestuariivirgaceae bacterium]
MTATAIKVGVIGAGAWGTALAAVAVRAGCTVVQWARSEDVCRAINQDHTNKTYLPGIMLPDGLAATTNAGDLADRDMVLLATPAQAMRAVMRQFTPALPAGIPAVINSKGIERETGLFLSDVLVETCPDLVPAVLSGPSFAADVTRGLPTAVTVAAQSMETAQSIAAALSLPTFRIYASTDLKGVQLCGAVKNVLAIACGICDGKRLGDSARAALITRGFAELGRLAHALNVSPATLSGLSGLGDLILTCSSRQSRNFSLGAALGEGQTLTDIMAARRTVTEGVHSAEVVVELAAKHDIEMPIAEAVYGIVTGRSSADDEISRLLARPVGSE